MDKNITLSKKRTLDLLNSTGCDLEDFMSEFGEHPHYFESEVRSWITKRVRSS